MLLVKIFKGNCTKKKINKTDDEFVKKSCKCKSIKNNSNAKA